MERDLDAHAARIAERQHGLLTGSRARRIGFSQHQIDTRIAQGRWIRVTRDVYAVRGSPHTWHRDALAACLAGHPRTVTSFVTSGALWGVCRPCVLPFVTVPMAASARSRIARVHRSDIDPLDVTRIGAIPTTRLGRTLVDLASIWTPEELERVVDTALDGELVRPQQVVAAIERAPRGVRRPGARALLDALAVWTDAIRPDSAAEARLLRRLDEWQFPVPVRQHRVHDANGTELARLDVAWPQWQVALEYDSRAHHGPRRIEHDENRWARVEALGWTIVPVTRLDLRPGELHLRNRLTAVLRRPAA